MLDDDEGVPRILQLAQGAHELGDVVKMQTGGGLVKQEQRAFFGHGLPAGAAAFGGFGQKASQFETLGFTTRQGGHGLAEFDVFQTHIDDGLQGADDVAVGGKDG